MGTFVSYYQQPAFRHGVQYLIGDTRIVLTYRDVVSFDIDCNKAASREIARLCQALEEGLDLTDGLPQFAEFAPHALDILQALDRYGFLTETAPSEAGRTISGAVFSTEVAAFVERAKVKARPILYEALCSGRASRAALIRYAREYYHVVHAGPGIIAGSLAHASDRTTREILEQFLASELGHDKLIASALASVGIGEAEIDRVLPLPETFSIISALQVAADQEPLTFKALVFLMEEASPEFHQAFVSACEYDGLPAAFWGPITAHAGINNEGAHGSISKRLLAQVEAVTQEERCVVLKQAMTMIENLVALEHALFRDP
jgi:Iron-containing redox enzyme